MVLVNKVIHRARRLVRRGRRLIWPRRYSEIQRLNLIYYAAPLAGNDLWRVNLERLRPYLHHFSRRVVAVVQGEGLVPFAEVRKELASWEIEWVVGTNDASLGEVTMFPELLARIASTEADVATFYGHTKGVSRPKNPAVALWRDAMYQACLDDLDAVKVALRGHSCAGPFKQFGGKVDCPEAPTIHFHFAGTFFWFRHDQLFTRHDWRQVPLCRFGVEAYLGQFFPEDEAACLYGEDAGCLYQMAEWEKMLSRWKTRAGRTFQPL
jgi:hypothetical protein